MFCVGTEVRNRKILTKKFLRVLKGRGNIFLNRAQSGTRTRTL